MGPFGTGKGKRFRSDRRALSPIFATLLMVSIVIIFGAVIYTYANNATTTASNEYVASTTKNSEAISERIGLENVNYSDLNNPPALTMSIINSGTVGNVTIKTLFLYDNAHQPAGNFYYNISAITHISDGAQFQGKIGEEGTFTIPLGAKLQPNTIYIIRLITERGSNFEYQFATPK